MLAYLQSRLSGFVGAAVILSGLIISVAPPFLSFVSTNDKPLFSAIIAALGGLKTWLSSSPIPTK
jgi:hypothetical protein